MTIKDRLKRWFKFRFAVLYPFGVIMALYCNSNDDSIMAGIWFILAGLIIRTWANGYAIKSEKLTTSGPYAFVRHPLYLGSALLAVGFVIMLQLSYFGLAFLAIMAIVYYRTIKKEEMFLENKFKDAYLDYKKHVPALLPTFARYREGEKWPFSVKRLLKSQEYKLFIWIIIIVIAFHIKEELIVEREKVDVKIVLSFVAAFLLSMIDVAGEFVRARSKKKDQESCR